MSRGDQLARQWKIIQEIVSSPRGKTAAELSDELDIGLRTVYRDLEALQAAGFPIYDDKVDGRNTWTVVDTYKHQIPIPFSLPELMALYFSRDMVKALHNTVFHDSLESLFEKIKTTLPPASVRHLHSIEKTFSVGTKQYKSYDRVKDFIDTVNEAALQKKSLMLRYRSMASGKETSRKVDPYRLWFFDGTFYLVGYCHLRADVRNFALERIRQLSITGEAYTVPEDFDFESLMSGSIGAFTGRPESIKILFSPAVAGYVEERIWHASQNLVKQTDGSLLFEAEVAVNDELKNWILSWGSGAEVLEPEGLVVSVRKEIQLLAERYAVK